jgi:repressor LexA
MLQVQRLRAIREKRGISQRELAARCNVGEKQIWRYENGESEPTAGQLIKIVRELATSSDYLLGLVDEQEDSYSGEELSTFEQEIVSLLRHRTVNNGLQAIQLIIEYIKEIEKE